MIELRNVSFGYDNCRTSVLHIEKGALQAYYPLDEAGIEKIKAYFNAKTGVYEIVQESA